MRTKEKYVIHENYTTRGAHLVNSPVPMNLLTPGHHLTLRRGEGLPVEIQRGDYTSPMRVRGACVSRLVVNELMRSSGETISIGRPTQLTEILRTSGKW